MALKRKKFEKGEIIQEIEENPIMSQNEILKYFVLPLLS
jgi:hypothetical protein